MCSIAAATATATATATAGATSAAAVVPVLVMMDGDGDVWDCSPFFCDKEVRGSGVLELAFGHTQEHQGIQLQTWK